jgi:hypothetical protein
MILALAACGPTAAEIKTAKTATYSADTSQIFQIALDVTKENYPIGGVDQDNYIIATRPRWYSKEGDLESAGAGGWAVTAPGSVLVQLYVKVFPVEGGVSVLVEPKTFEQVPGSPKPRELAPEDPYLPPWILGRADSLQLAIYERAKAYAR